ncbi:MAG: recombinase family protein, partial [Candidatus Woesebacteria bacterium]|nr:recombinase family protein [Candidatus Woesebacteria bacterium]
MDIEKSLKYGLYARKSSESEERQVLSIDSQISEMKQIAEKGNLLIAKTYRENHSAKLSRSRPEFIELLSDIEKEVVNSIIVWSPDRLSRNAGDLGDLVDLMDIGKLFEIRTYNQVFSNNPNHKFLLMILCSQAKLENDNRAINIKRGVRNKYSLGWLPGPAPIGYANLKIGSEATIILDRKKGFYVRQIFEKVGLRNTKVKNLRKWLATTPLRTSNGNPISKSTIYKILRNPFYYGKLKYKDELLEGKQPHIIEKELFDIVQGKLKPFKKVEWNHRSLGGISKFITCGECGDHIFEWYKNRKLKSGERHPHFYFRCSRFKKPSCTQSSIVYTDLFKQLVDLIDQLDISKIDFPLQIQREILNYFLINTVST